MNRSKSEHCAFDAWNPGITSQVPTSLRPEITLFRPQNSRVSYTDARELADFCGLDEHELARLTTERLITHELLVRVTADLSVPDGPNYEDLGISLRSMVAKIFDTYIAPDLASIEAQINAELDRAKEFVDTEISTLLSGHRTTPTEKNSPSLLSSLLAKLSRPSPKPAKSQRTNDAASGAKSLKSWESERASQQDRLYWHCLDALLCVTAGVVRTRGRVLNDPELLSRLCMNLISNRYGSEAIGGYINSYIEDAIDKEGYRKLPAQRKPVILNIKGASASGKSTVRPQQRQLASRLGIPWEDFALISPDYWRKYLLDYESLGDDFKYGAMLTGRELAIIDKKLDQHMAAKFADGEMSHLLIDRFRFDSFTPDVDRDEDSTLLTRFGDQVFMFFMITAPEQTVERAWLRGSSTGRYKAVDDLLYHNIEAFNGMPELFFSWIQSSEKQVHFEFLDNNVPLNHLPKTAAYGWNERITVLDTSVLMNIDRYRKVNLDAKNPDEVFKHEDVLADNNTDFVHMCCNEIAEVLFADQRTTRPYAKTIDGKLRWWDQAYIESHDADSDLYVAMRSIGYQGDACGTSFETGTPVVNIDEEKRFTLGDWGSSVDEESSV